MIAAWMLYCTIVGMLLVGAGHLAEQVVLARGGSTRRVWTWALVGAVSLPVLSLLVRDEPLVGLEAGAAGSVGAIVLAESVDLLSVLDNLLVRVWLVGSLALGGMLVAALFTVARRRRSWSRAEVDGVPVLVSEDLGPAVVGVVRASIVLPRWALAAEGAERALLLRHEQEHVDAGDPRLMLLAALLVVALPWNVALWRLAQRLRLAVEVDCDRRVVTCPGVDLRRYGVLLLTVGRRRSAGAAAAIGFSRSRSLLEERIDRMTLRRRPGLVRTLATGLAVATLLGAAWYLPQPVRAADVSSRFDPCPEEAVPAPAAPATRA